MKLGISLRVVGMLILLVTGWLSAQGTLIQLSGTIRDAETNDPLPGVNILIVGTPQGAASDRDGYFELKLPEGVYVIRFEMIGYQTYQMNKVVLQEGRNRILNVYLIQQALEYGKTIEVVGEKELSKEPLGSAVDIGRMELWGRAGSMEDVTRTLQTFPGVVSDGDFSGRMYVRGGRVDENLVLLDRIYIYDPYHLNGLVSIFNPELIKDIEFYAGGFPAKYGQAMSAIIEVYNRYGRRGPIQGSVSSSFITTSALLEGALPGPRGSFLLSARLNYYDKIMDWLDLPDSYFRPSFYDYQVKLFYPVAKKHLLEINALFSGDALRWNIDPEDEFLDLPQGSGKFLRKQALDISNIDWKWIFSDRAFVHTNAAYTHQYFDSRYILPATHWIHFNVYNYDLRSEFTLMPFPHHKVESGLYLHLVDLDYTLSFPRVYWSLFYTSNKNSSLRLSDDSTLVSADYAHFYKYGSYFLQDQWEIVPGRFITNLGFRIEYLDASSQLIFNPRLNFVYHFNPRTLVKGAWGLFSQYSRDPLVFNPEAGNPNAKAPAAEHYILGMQHRFPKDYLMRLELYYKKFRDLITEDPKINYTNSGSGYSYGVDLFLQKKVSQNWNGWLSYSLGVSRRRDHPGEPYYYPQQDQRHTLSLVVNYQTTNRWNIGIKWLFGTGKPFTEIERVEYVPDSLTGGLISIPVEGPVNGSRFPAYSRLDLRIEKQFTFLGKSMETYLEVINLFNRKNVYDYNYNPAYTRKKAIHQLPVLPILGIKLML